MSAAKTARPRAPSGGSSTLAPSRQAAPVDLLGLGDFTAPSPAPVSTAPTAQFGGFTAAPTAASSNTSWGDFSGASQVQQAPSGGGFNMFDAPTASQQTQGGPQTLNMMSGLGSQTRRTTTPAKPVLSETDVRKHLLFVIVS